MLAHDARGCQLLRRTRDRGWRDNGAGHRRGPWFNEDAIEADPDLGQAWSALSQAYQRVKDTASLDKLRADYVAKFNQNLP